MWVCQISHTESNLPSKVLLNRESMSVDFPTPVSPIKNEMILKSHYFQEWKALKNFQLQMKPYDGILLLW